MGEHCPSDSRPSRVDRDRGRNLHSAAQQQVTETLNVQSVNQTSEWSQRGVTAEGDCGILGRTHDSSTPAIFSHHNFFFISHASVNEP